MGWSLPWLCGIPAKIHKSINLSDLYSLKPWYFKCCNNTASLQAWLWPGLAAVEGDTWAGALGRPFSCRVRALGGGNQPEPGVCQAAWIRSN